MEFIKNPSVILLALLFSGCGAVPVSDRYSDKKNNDLPAVADRRTVPQGFDTPKGFDFTPFETKLSFMDAEVATPESSDAWYRFNLDQKPARFTKTAGYRVQLLSTDNYTEAQKMQDSIIASRTASQTYLQFEAPFYKVKVGDMPDPNQAAELQFKLRQLGFKNPVITQDTVNIRQK